MTRNADHAALRVPPQNLEAERAVLGGILLDPEAIHTVVPILRKDDFYEQSHQRIFNAIVQLAESSRSVDLLTLTEQLRSLDSLEAVGGASYLASLTDQVATAANVAEHARIVREKATLRQIIHASTKIIEGAYEGGEEVGEFLDRVEKVIFEISEKRTASALIPSVEAVKEAFYMIEKAYDAQGSISGVATGYPEMDRILSGLQPADLVIVAGRPSMGKTAFCLNIVQNAAIRHNVPCAVFSLEMSNVQLAMRMLCAEARVDSTKVRGGGLNEDDWLRLTEAAGKVSEAPIYIDDSGTLSPLEMRAKARRLKARHGLGLIVVDYLQLMRSSGKAESREKEISEISRSLKAMAKELSVPVVALSQLNRAVETRVDKRPMMADLRESGAIEQDADVIAFIYRDEVYNEETTDEGIAEIIISKHRNGQIGTVKLAFLSNFARFEPLESRY